MDFGDPFSPPRGSEADPGLGHRRLGLKSGRPLSAPAGGRGGASGRPMERRTRSGMDVPGSPETSPPERIPGPPPDIREPANPGAWDI